MADRARGTGTLGQATAGTIASDWSLTFIPVLGYADDAIVVVAVLRSVVRAVGLEPLRGNWPGTANGFVALCRLAGLQSEFA